MYTGQGISLCGRHCTCIHTNSTSFPKLTHLYFQIQVLGMKRTIEVSHWGNIAVEETYHMKHVGAELQVTIFIPNLICT